MTLGNERVYEVVHALAHYVKSPSLRHIRDPNALAKLAQEIVVSLDRQASIWRKWDGPREPFLRSAAICWIPVGDLLAFLNGLPGPPLTRTDVEQRLKAFHEEPYEPYPNEAVQAACLALYEREKADGTEMPAIVGALQDFILAEEQRLHDQRQVARRKHAEEDRIALEKRFLSGADCKWTSIEKSKAIFRRINGRVYKLTPTSDKKWDLFRIENFDDPKPPLIGRYGARGDVTKALSKLAYEPEPRW
jgi:hypothetical protein